MIPIDRQESLLYEEFCNSAEAELLTEMRDYFIEAKQKAGQWISEMDGKSVEDPQYQDWVLWAADHGLCIDPTEEYWQSKRR